MIAHLAINRHRTNAVWLVLALCLFIGGGLAKSGGLCQQVLFDPHGRKSMQLKNCYAFDNLYRIFFFVCENLIAWTAI